MNQTLKRIFDMLGSLSFNQKILMGTLLSGAVIAITFFYSGAQQDYDVMLSGLEESDAAAVVGNLRKQGIPYKLAENGTTILVPRNRKEELRLDVFKDDLIKSEKTVGFGALGSLPFGMTDWQEQKYDQKIISDEVVNTLEKIQGIKKARVILAQSEDSLFSENKIDPTASVMLIVDPGFRLRPEQVRTVRALVAHSVPGMKPENVALSDSMGNALSDDVNVANASGGSEADTTRSNFEKQKSKDILEMLTPLVGPNNAVVKVSAVMNFDRSESRIKRFIPTGGTADAPTGIPVSVQQNSEVYTGKDKPTGQSGQPGVATNTPSYTAGDAGKDDANGKSGKDYQNVQTTTNYEVSSEEKTVVHAPGTVERMTVAVVVNKVLTPTQSEELTKLISSASGLDESRGDAVTVSGLQFSPELQDQQKESIDLMKQTNQNQMILTLAQLLGVVVLAVAALFIFYKLLYRPLQGTVVDDGDMEYGGGGGHDYNDMTEPLLSASNIPALEAKLDPEIEHMRESINSLVRKDPAEAARVLVSYMKDMG